MARTMDEKLAKSLLDAIALGGEIDSPQVNQIIASNPYHIIDSTSGKTKIKNPSLFNLIIAQPQSIAALSSLEIRCCICKRVITYPAWYHFIHYAINHFHFFVCFNQANPTEPTTNCMRGLK